MTFLHSTPSILLFSILTQRHIPFISNRTYFYILYWHRISIRRAFVTTLSVWHPWIVQLIYSAVLNYFRAEEGVSILSHGQCPHPLKKGLANCLPTSLCRFISNSLYCLEHLPFEEASERHRCRTFGWKVQQWAYFNLSGVHKSNGLVINCMYRRF